jgi:hypothetical protein
MHAKKTLVQKCKLTRRKRKEHARTIGMGGIEKAHKSPPLPALWSDEDGENRR